jgi:hypothetical protein
VRELVDVRIVFLLRGKGGKGEGAGFSELEVWWRAVGRTQKERHICDL